MKTEQEFWSKVDSSSGIDACWPWIGKLDNGYGVLKWKGKKTNFNANQLLGSKDKTWHQRTVEEMGLL